MFPNDPYLCLLIWNERHKDRLRKAEQERLIRIARRRPSRIWRLHPHRTVARWMGEQLVRWGQKLQHYGRVDWPSLADSPLGVAGVHVPEE
jgi:hypothetical protein